MAVYRIASLRLYIIPALLLLIPACIQGGPFYDYDSGDYLHTATRLSASLSRPIYYGVFLLLSTGGMLLWLALLAQALVLCRVLHKLLEALNRFSARNLIALALLGTLLSPLARLCCQIMPDCFATSFILLSVVWLVRREVLSRFDRLLWVFLAFTHFALLPLLAVILLMGLVSSQPKQKLFTLRPELLFTALLGIGLVLSNYGKVKRLTLNPASAAFQVAKLARSGALQVYQQQTSDAPMASRDFNSELWQPEGIIARLGGLSDPQQRLARLQKQVMQNAAAQVLHRKQIWADFKDLVFRHSFHVSEYRNPSYTATVLRERFPWHYRQAASQRWDRIVPLSLLDRIFGISMAIGFFLCLGFLLQYRSSARFLMVCCALLLVFGHHALVAWYSIPDNRLAARVSTVWVLLPLAMMLPHPSSKRQSVSGANPLPPREPSHAGAASPLP